MFYWTSDFETGIRVIDEQHKTLFEIGNDLSLLIVKKGNTDHSDEILIKLDELLEYSKYHFSTEEDLFEKYHYQFTDDHKYQHQSFITYLDNIKFSEFKEEHERAVKNLVNYIAKWIFKHISNSDAKFAITLTIDQKNELSS